MNITINILLVALNIFFGILHQEQVVKHNVNERDIQSDILPSGFYFINDTLGTEKIHRETKKSYFIDPQRVISLSNIRKVKITSIKNKNFGKTEKKYGLLFTLNEEGKDNLEYASRIAFENNLKMSLIIKDELIVVFNVNSQINNDIFFIEIETSKSKLKEIEKIIKAELKEL